MDAEAGARAILSHGSPFCCPKDTAFKVTPDRQLVALSPDGSQPLSTSPTSGCTLRAMSGLPHAGDPRKRNKEHQESLNPVFSPDGQSIAFFSQCRPEREATCDRRRCARTICP